MFTTRISVPRLAVGYYHARMSSSNHIDLSGVYPPIATPFCDTEEISYGHLESNFRKWNNYKFRGMICNILTVVLYSLSLAVS